MKIHSQRSALRLAAKMARSRAVLGADACNFAMVARDQMHDALTRISRPFSPRYARRRKVTRAAMPRPAAHAKHILAWLFAALCAASCAAHADDVTPSLAAPADPSKLTAGTL